MNEWLKGWTTGAMMLNNYIAQRGVENKKEISKHRAHGAIKEFDDPFMREFRQGYDDAILSAFGI